MDNGVETIREWKRRKLAEGGTAKLDPSADSDSAGTNSSDDEVADVGAATDLRGPVLSWFRHHLVVDEKHRDLKELHRLDERLLKHLEKEGFSQCFPVQHAVWRELSGGFDQTHDLCVCSPTGSGKTLAYCLPIAQTLSRRAEISLHCLGAIIVLPTSALASQVFGVAKAVCGCVGLGVEILGIRSVTVETEMLQQGANGDDPCFIDGLNSIDVLVTTPGHLLVHLKETKALTLKHLKFLVVDEADILMKGGDAFEKLASCLVERLRLDKHLKVPSGSSNRVFRPETSMRSRVLKMMVSATVTRDPGALSSLDIHHPRLIAPRHKTSRYMLPEGLEEFKLVCPAPLRPLILVKLLKDFSGETTLIFTRTVEIASRLCTMLCELDEFKGLVAEYSAQVAVKRRDATLKAFREKRIRIMVASDAMSRGMDVANIKNVVNYDTPSHVKKYIHRVGRTARAGDGGKAYSLIRKSIDEDAFEQLRAKLGRDLKSIVPDIDNLRDLKPRVDEAIEKMKGKLLGYDG